MKRLFLLIIPLLVSCNTEQMKYGQGGRNDCQYVKEQVPELREDIASVEVIKEDSLLSDIGLTFASIRAGEIKNAYYQCMVSYDEMSRVLDSCKAELMYVEQSWQYGNVSKKLKKFMYQWRKVYTVRVTMKSGVTKEPRVLMDQDGITPRRLESEFINDLRQYHIDFTY